MYQKILAPLDGSQTGECTLAHIKEVATGCQVAKVVLLFVVEPLHQVYEVDADFLRDAAKRADAYAQNYLASIASRLKKDGVAVETAIAHGRAADQILDYAKKTRFDFIIMSTHGRAGVTRWVLGSTTDRVLRHSPVPVFVVPPAGCRV